MSETRRPLHLSVETTEPRLEGSDVHSPFTPADDLPSVSNAPRAATLTLVTTDDCHLCDHAHGVLEKLGVPAREISVDSDEAQVLAGHGVALAFLPVLTDGERVVAYGRFSEQRLRKDLGL